MSENVLREILQKEDYRIIGYRAHPDVSMPSVEEIRVMMENLRALLFPGYFCCAEPWSEEWENEMSSKYDNVKKILEEQVFRAYCFQCDLRKGRECEHCKDAAERNVEIFLKKLPEVKRILYTDIKAMYEYDPAAKSVDEVILCYPGAKAMMHYRVAHVLYELEVPVIPRIITEIAHSETGIDIHPGAKIGEHFFIDHGTGIVIGETCEIGKNVRVYQGVTLGAKSFSLDEEGRPIKGIPRHPIVEDDVIIYAGATVLGRVRVGRGAIIGSNVTVLHDVPPGAKIVQKIEVLMR